MRSPFALGALLHWEPFCIGSHFTLGALLYWEPFYLGKGGRTLNSRALRALLHWEPVRLGKGGRTLSPQTDPGPFYIGSFLFG